MNPTMDDLLREENWLEWRSLVPAPALRQTELTTTDQSRAEFVEGCRILRLDERRRGGDGLPGPSPIQLVIADTLNAGRRFNGVLEPRRATKTTAIQAVALGRCQVREDYVVGWTIAKADGGTKVGERFRKDILVHVDRRWPDKSTRPFIVSVSNGHEHIRWPHGSWFNIYAPQNEGFTSGGFDMAWVDEAQDASPEISESLLTSIPPTLDGRFGAQMIGSGTAPDYRSGNLLWSLLHMEDAGVVMHAVPDDTDPEAFAAWEPDDEHPQGRVRELVELSHPGVDFTTPLADVKSNYGAMSRKAFTAEYLGLAGNEGSNVSIVSQPKWQASTLPLAKAGDVAPKRFSFAAVVNPTATAAAVGVAWLGRDKKVHVGLLHHQAGVEGFRKRVLLLARKHKKAITYDGGSNATAVEVVALREARPAPTERVLVTRDIGKSAVNLVNLINQDRLRHHDQPELNRAVEIAVKRPIGTYGAWGFGGPKGREDYDIVGLEAISLAAWVLDQEKGGSAAVEIDFF